MIVLGIETSTEVCSVGLFADGIACERSLRERRIHSEKLLVLVDEVLREAGRDIRSVNAVAVSAGPGSFTGLRIGVSAAKGLVAALACPFIAVPTFLGVAETARRLHAPAEPFIAALDAKQGEWYCIESGEAEKGDTPYLLGADACRDRVEGKRLVTDAPGAFSNGPVSIHDVRDLCSGLSIAMLGRDALQKGRVDDVATFEPLYVKDFVVRTTSRPTRTRSDHGLV